jgi:cysteine desulfurase
MIYLDMAATTKPKEEVIETIVSVLREDWGNPSSKYHFGKRAKTIVEESRITIAEFIGAKPSEIIFTSGACESNSLAIIGYLKKNPGLFFTTEIEHKSIMNCSKTINTEYIPVNKYGDVNLSILNSILGDYYSRNKLVSIHFANNEIGTIQDIKEIAKIVHSNNGILHTDATQIISDRPINVEELGIDMMSFSGQKFGAPKGIGVLYVRDGIKLEPIIYGSQENSLRGGTENVAYIAGLAKATELIEYPRCNGFGRNLFMGRLRHKINDIYLIGDETWRLQNNICVCIKGVESNTLVGCLDVEDVLISTGSACNSSSIEPSYVLKAIGIPEEDIYSVVRITADFDKMTIEEMEEVTYKIANEVEMLRSFKI